MSKDINIETIMQEIRAEIREKGYTDDLLSFNDVVVDTSRMNVQEFDKITFNEEIYTINHSWNVQAYRQLSGSKISIFIKKVIRKLVYFFVEPIVMEQDGFNASIVRAMNQMNCFVDEKVHENEELKKQVAELTKKLKEIEEKVG